MTSPESRTFTPENSKAFLDVFELGPWSSGVLSGTTVAISDGIDIEERLTGCGNTAWLIGRIAAAKNAVALDMMLSSGAQCCGKARVNELCFTICAEYDAGARSVNANFSQRMIGGAARGIASAVSCGLVNFGLGLDAGGSLLVSAADAGLVAWRASHGAVSGAGILPVAPSFDSVAVVCRQCDQLPLVSESLLCRPTLVPDAKPQIVVLTDALKVMDPSFQSMFEAALSQLKAAGFSVSELTLKEITGDSTATLDDCYMVFEQLFGMELWSTFGGWVEHIMPILGEEAKLRLFAARHLDRSLLPSLSRIRTFYRDCFSAFLGSGRILCIPTVPSLQPAVSISGKGSDCIRYTKQVLALASFSSLIGSAQVSVPLCRSGATPGAMSFIAAKGADSLLVGVVSQFDSLIECGDQHETSSV